jgi:hypothetical protein
VTSLVVEEPSVSTTSVVVPTAVELDVLDVPDELIAVFDVIAVLPASLVSTVVVPI